MARAPGWEDRRTRKVPVGCTMSSASAVSRVTAKPQMACGSVASHILPTCNHSTPSFLCPMPPNTPSASTDAKEEHPPTIPVQAGVCCHLRHQ